MKFLNAKKGEAKASPLSFERRALARLIEKADETIRRFYSDYPTKKNALFQSDMNLMEDLRKAIDFAKRGPRL